MENKDIKELEEHLTDEEKIKYDKAIDISIISMVVFSFGVGLFFEIIGLIFYFIYNYWLINFQIKKYPTKIQEWVEDHNLMIYCLIGSLLNILITYFITSITQEPQTSIWG